MASAAGSRAKAACKRPLETSVWGDAATSIANMVPMRSETLTDNPVIVSSQACQGQASASARDQDAVAYPPSGNLVCELWYESLEYLLLAAIGFESPDVPAIVNEALTDQGGSPAPDDGSPTSFRHVFEPDTNMEREAWATGEREASIPGGDYEWDANDQKVRTVSIPIEKQITVGGSTVHQFDDCMVDALTIRGKAGQDAILTAEFALVPHSAQHTGTSASWALPVYNPRPCLFPQMHFYLTVPGDTIATEIPIAEFEIAIKNNLKSDDYDSGGNDGSISTRAQPNRDNLRETTLKLKFARMSASTTPVRDYCYADSEVQAMIVLTGPAISGSTYPRSFKFCFPACKVITASFPVAGPGVITGDAELRAHLPSAPATTYAYDWIVAAFGGVYMRKKQEFFVTLTNTRGSCFSRDANTTYPLP